LRNRVEDLRNHVFEALERLRDAEGTDEIRNEIQRSKAVAELAQVGVNSARAETEFLKAVQGSQGSGFVPLEPRGGHASPVVAQDNEGDGE